MRQKKINRVDNSLIGILLPNNTQTTIETGNSFSFGLNACSRKLPLEVTEVAELVGRGVVVELEVEMEVESEVVIEADSGLLVMVVEAVVVVTEVVAMDALEEVVVVVDELLFELVVLVVVVVLDTAIDVEEVAVVEETKFNVTEEDVLVKVVEVELELLELSKSLGSLVSFPLPPSLIAFALLTLTKELMLRSLR
jgi:hypothetical protein